MVSKDLLFRTFDTALKFEGEEGECQFSFCCLGQHSQDVLSPAPAGNIWRDYEIILLTYLTLITRQSSGWNDWVIFLDLVQRDFRRESLEPMPVGHRPSCSLSSVENPTPCGRGRGRAEKVKNKWADYFCISWLKHFHIWYTDQWPWQDAVN